MTTVKILALKNLLGESFIDYAKYLQNQMERKGWDLKEFFHEFAGQFIEEDEPCNVNIGYILYIPNLPYYSHFKPNGNGRGSNLVQTSDQDYIGFSSIYKKGSQPITVIADADKDLFCRQDDVEANHDHHTRICKIIHENPKRFYQDFLSIQGKTPVFYFSANRINEFRKTKKLKEFWG
ncbi:MAG: hypothetical protein ACRYGR_03165 [Janthinobacterium lividum]